MECATCFKKYKSVKTFRFHQKSGSCTRNFDKSVVYNEKVRCRTCGKAYKKGSQARYFEGTHGMKFECTRGKIFSPNNNLLRHKKQCSQELEEDIHFTVHSPREG